MVKNHFIVCLLLGTALVLACPATFANVWIDESFEDGIDFGPQNNGMETQPADGLDVYSFNPISNPTTVNHSGMGVTELAFNGGESYRRDAGQTIC